MEKVLQGHRVSHSESRTHLIKDKTKLRAALTEASMSHSMSLEGQTKSRSTLMNARTEEASIDQVITIAISALVTTSTLMSTKKLATARGIGSRIT